MPAPHTNRINGHARALPANDDACVFIREGEYWTIAYHGDVLRLRDSKGLRCVAFLLGRPTEFFQVEELLVRAGIRITRTGDEEHARIAVTKRIKAAVAKVAQHHRTLGYHLSTTIKTGYACAYVPDPDRPIAWTV